MKRHRNDAVERFWIDQDVCCICGTCFEAAPGNVKSFEGDELSYVFKQPENDKELEELRAAIAHSPVEAVVEDE